MKDIGDALEDARTEELDEKRAAERWREWLAQRLDPATVDTALRGYGIRRRMRAVRFDPGLIPGECRRWVDLASEGSSLILAGPPGTGKTTAAVWCLRELYLRRSRAGEAVPSARLVKTRDLYEAVFEKNRSLVRDAERLDALVLDDWGTQYEHDWPLAELEALIDRRWEEQLPTIVTTNTQPTEGEASLKARLPRSYDRLTGEPGPGVVVLDRPSLRQRRSG